VKFTNILKTLIVEASKYEFLYNKYFHTSDKESAGKKLPFDTFKKLIFTDPKTLPQNFDVEGASLKDMSDVKPGAYSEWVIKKFLGDKYKSEEGYDKEHPFYKEEFREYQRQFLEDLPRLKELLTKYERFKGSLQDKTKKDINNVTSVKELSNLQVLVGSGGETTELELYRGKKVKKEKVQDAKKNFIFPGSEILQVGTDYTLVRISDKGELGSKAASFFGGYHNVSRGETNWCTSPENSSYSQTYRNQGPLYIFLANDDKGEVGEITGLPTERYQIHFPTDQYKNRRNETIPFVEWLAKGQFSEFKDVFKDHFKRDLVTNDGQEFRINSFTHGAVGKFVAIYGFEELFNEVPRTIKKFIINNNDRNEIIIKLPEALKECKQLINITLDNCISEVPEFICEFSKLQFLILSNNKDLKHIPECVGNMPNLLLFNLKGSDQAIVPNSVKEKGTQLGDSGAWDLT